MARVSSEYARIYALATPSSTGVIAAAQAKPRRMPAAERRVRHEVESASDTTPK